MPGVGLDYTYGADALRSDFGGIDFTPPAPEAVPGEGPNTSELVGAGMRLNSDLIAPLVSHTFGIDYETLEDGFDIGDELRSTPYESNMAFVGVRNRKAMEAVKRQVDMEDTDRKTLAASGMYGQAIGMATSLVSPFTLAPGGAVVQSARRGFTIGKSALSVGTAAALATAGQEAVLQASQVTRTPGESAVNIGGSFLLGGILGGVAGSLSRGEWTDLVAKTDGMFRAEPLEPGVTSAPGFGTSSAGAAAVERGSNRLKDEGLFKALKFLNRQDPMIRLQLSNLDSARTAVRDLAESPLELQANREGFVTSEGGTAETRIKQWNAPLYRAVSTMDDAYARYFFGKDKVSTFETLTAPLRSGVARRRGTSDKMGYKEFKEEIGRALSDDDTHPIPEVQEAAAAFRTELFDHGREQAVEVGLFGKEMQDAKSAGWLHRVYNRGRIVAQRPEFKGRIVDHLLGGQRKAIREQAELEAGRLAIEIDQAQRRVDDLFAQVSGKERRIQEFQDPSGKTAMKTSRDYTARSASLARETEALNELKARYEALDMGVRSSSRASMARDLVDVSRRRTLKAAELDRLTKLRDEHAAVDNLDEVHELEGRLRLVENELGSLEKQHTRLSEITSRTGKATPEEIEEMNLFTSLSRAEIEAISDEVIDTILGTADGRILLPRVFGGGDAGPRGALKARTLRIPDAEIADFLERDIEHIARSYTRTMSADIELTRKFGSVDMAETVAKINDEANARIESATTEAQRRKIHAERDEALRDVQGIRDRLRGTYAMPSNPDGILVRSGRLARNLNYMTKLGGATISAFSDLAKPIMNYGLTSVFRDGFVPLIRSLQSVKVAGTEAREAGTAYDMVLDTRAMSFGEIADDYGRGSKFERAVSGAASRFGVASLLSPWTDMMKQFSTLIIMNNFLRAAGEVATGTASKKIIGRLAASNISPDMAKRIVAQFEKHGDVVKGNRHANTGDWTDPQAVEAFRAMIVREVDKTIVTVGQDKPLWISTELGKTIGQFKSFAFSSVQKTLFAGLQQRDAATLNGVLAMLGLGLLSHVTYSKVSGREIDWDPKVLAANALDKSGLMGWLMEANNFAEKASSGRIGLSALTGKEVTRYQSRNITSALAGPTFGTVQDVLNTGAAALSEKGLSGDDVHKARQALIVGQNLFWLRTTLDKVEDRFIDVVGLKPRTVNQSAR